MLDIIERFNILYTYIYIYLINGRIIKIYGILKSHIFMFVEICSRLCANGFHYYVKSKYNLVSFSFCNKIYCFLEKWIEMLGIDEWEKGQRNCYHMHG